MKTKAKKTLKRSERLLEKYGKETRLTTKQRRRLRKRRNQEKENV